tara:strand:+ start:1899 stop:2129 length:231 start_codon:yes stop_codon:yes gene_type:complete
MEVSKIVRILPIIAGLLSAVLWITSLKYNAQHTAQELSELQDDYLKRINDLEERVSKLEGQFGIYFEQGRYRKDLR